MRKLEIGEAREIIAGSTRHLRMRSCNAIAKEELCQPDAPRLLQAVMKPIKALGSCLPELNFGLGAINSRSESGSRRHT